MKRLLIVGLIGLVMALGLSPLELGETTTSETIVIKVATPNPNPYHRLYEDLLYPSVKIFTPQGTGSGVVIETTDKHGYTLILTAAHVVGNYSAVTATFYTPLTPLDRGDLSASVVITDTVKDLALLRITHDTGRITHHARLASRDYKPYIFTPVWVVGASLGYPPRPSSGHLSALCDSVANFWEVSAPIVPGNSGGGVFLKDTHELIGIAVWVRTYRGQLITTMAGIVPIHEIYDFLEGSRK